MISKMFSMFFTARIRNASIKHYQPQLAASILLLFLISPGVSANPTSDKYYLRIEQSKTSENDDLKITSIGMLALKNNMVGHVDLTQMESDINGKGLTLDLGGGYAFNWDVSLYLSLGISLGYNSNRDEFIAAYYPEAGIVVDITKTFGLTASTKRIYHLYENNEDIVMLGLVFRK